MIDTNDPAEMRFVANYLRRLKGQICPPSGFPKDYMDFIREQRLAVFKQWPSGHWSITDSGHDFLAENS